MFEKEKGKEKSIVLTTRDLILLFVFFMVILSIVFAIGLMVGKNFGGEEQALTQNRPPAGGDERAITSRSEEMAPIQEMTLPPSRTDGRIPGVPPPSESRTAQEPAATANRPVTATPAAPAGAVKTEPKPAGATPLPAVKPPVPAATGTPVETGFYVVQAMASASMAEARKMVDSLKAKGYEAFVKIPEPGSADKYYRVQVGKFRDAAHAREQMNKLIKDGFTAIVKKVAE